MSKASREMVSKHRTSRMDEQAVGKQKDIERCGGFLFHADKVGSLNDSTAGSHQLRISFGQTSYRPGNLVGSFKKYIWLLEDRLTRTRGEL